MKKCFLILFLVSLFFSCTENNPANKNTLESLPDKEVMEIAINFAKGKLKVPKLTITGNTAIVSQEKLMYVIDSKNILRGLVDDNATEDAIVSIPSYNNMHLLITEHLVILNESDKMKLAYAFEDKMKILAIKEGKVIAQIPSMSQDSPMSDCNVCKDTTNFVFRDGKLIKAE